ncbi:arylamine N-acetyltransferase [Streptomyces sp. XM4011]|uniref:arylamine N-acetyltransferase family protein n=1 Tax=Streptomyces sp. XM4011 TaxID=2929780 RepID=UPI001FF842A8|nr:arylamine N-acetyltransferase [Streptomyces sp. XM4011]MCK1815694.1 arylamine N-acetyltransferase [Streptomyces sp. XM4011]
MTDPQLIHDYLDRIGVHTIRAPDAGFLAELHERHLSTVPFENIDVHLGLPILLGDAALEKVVQRRRGGTCRELNGSAFPTLLTALGFKVTLLGSRVFIGGRPSFPMAHTVVRVDCPGPWLVDVGFGKDGPRFPLRLDEPAPQPDPVGTFRVRDGPAGDTEVLRNAEPVLRIEPAPRAPEDFRPVLRWFESAPESPFRDNLFCTRMTDYGRVTLRGNILTKTGSTFRTKQLLDADDDIRKAYEEHFGIILERLPPIPSKG